MWTGSTTLYELERARSWNVEIFEHRALQPAAAFPLCDLSEVFSERKRIEHPQREPERRFHYIGLEHVAPRSGALRGDPWRSGHQLRSRCRRFEPGDLLYARLRPYLNKVYLAKPELGPGICSNEFIVLTPRPDRIRPRFARAMLTSEDVLDFVTRRQSGSTLPRIQMDDLLELAIPLPPLETQDAFERFIETREAEIDALSEKLSSLREVTQLELGLALRAGRPPRQDPGPGSAGALNSRPKISTGG